jgi:uncharacterized membrane protein YdjX (TVP38/TMEM64 family)
MRFEKKDTRLLLTVVGVLVIFLASSFVIQKNIDFFKSHLGNSIGSMLAFTAIEFLVTVFAPAVAFPLFPLAAQTWGWFLTGVLSFIGVFAGSIFAFEISRRYGSSIVKRFAPIKEVSRLSSLIPQKNLLVGLIVLRITVPIDILSYSFGMFSKITRTNYVIGTFLGLIPMVFLIAYISSLSFVYQVFLSLFGLVAFGVLWYIGLKKVRQRIAKELLRE